MKRFPYHYDTTNSKMINEIFESWFGDIINQGNFTEFVLEKYGLKWKTDGFREYFLIENETDQAYLSAALFSC